MKYNCKILKIFVWIPVIMMACAIFGFSKQDGTQSEGLSRKAAICILQAADEAHFIDLNQDNQEQLIQGLQFPIRKCGHMTEYALLGMLVYVALTVDEVAYKFKKYIALLAGFAFASSDEIHQLFVPGRSGRFTDVLIDTAGCTIGILLCVVCEKYINRHLKNRHQYEN
jgi:VanZ family protein